MLTMKRLSLTIPVIATAVAITATSGSEAKTLHHPTVRAAGVCGSTAKLPTRKAGVLTIATSSAAYAPYFIDHNPSNGKGFESAVAYAIAKELGYTPANVRWVVQPVSSAFAPANASFDFDVNEVSITPARAKQVTFSTPYFSDPLTVLVARGGELRNVKKLGGLANAVIGVQLNTTSLQAVTDLVDPLQQAAAYDTPADIVAAYKDKDVNAIVTDLGTSVDLVNTELPTTKVLGQFSYPGDGTWGLVLQKHSKLTQCVDRALGALKSSGTLAKLTKKWIATDAKIPVLKP